MQTQANGELIYDMINGFLKSGNLHNREALKIVPDIKALLEYAKQSNMKTIAFYLLLSQAVFKSFIRWEFTVGSYVMSFLYLYLLFSKVKIKFVRQ